jgi:thioredoxin reductase (NADPH)
MLPNSCISPNQIKQNPKRKQIKSQKVHPVIIIGSGPAAYTSAIYTARAGLHPVLYEGKVTNEFMPGGQLKTTSMVENYPGFPNDIDGSMLVDRMRLQGKRFGTKIVPKMIIDADFTRKPFKLFTDKKDNPIYAHSVIIATGARPKRLGIPGEESFWQKGISTCAVCDGPFYKNKIVAVVGGGDGAAEEALHLAKIASKVYLIVRKGSLKASNIMANRVKSHSKIKILWETIVKEAKGKKHLESISILNKGRLENLSLDGLFYAIGHVPNSGFLKHSGLSLDSDGFVKTQRGSPKTNIPGIFAAGDIHDRIYRQAITAAGLEQWLHLNVKNILFFNVQLK